MQAAEERLFPDGIPAYLNLSSFAKLLGVSPTKAAQIAENRPEMVEVLPTMRDRSIRSELYFELTRKTKGTRPTAK